MSGNTLAYGEKMYKKEFCVLIKHCFLMGKNTIQTKE